MIKDQDIMDLCKYRFEQANESISEADILLSSGLYRGAINRAYYAMFYSLQVFVVMNRVTVSKHSGVITFFDKNYIKPGIIDRKFSKWLHRLFDLRQDADYGDMFMPSEEQCREAVNQSKDFVKEMEQYFEKVKIS